MVEDTPNDLVHDIAAEAVFGSHPLGRPVIGSADVISSVSKRALAGYHRRAYQGEKIVLAAAGNVRHDELVALLDERRNGAASAAPASRGSRSRERPPERSLPAQGHRAVPRLPERARNLAPRRAPVRRLAHGRDRRRLGVVATLPGDPREARDGVLGLQLLVAVRRRGADRRLRRARARTTSRSASRSPSRSSPTSPRGNVRADELARAKENLKGRILLSLESTSARMTRLGKSTITETPLAVARDDRASVSRP